MPFGSPLTVFHFFVAKESTASVGLQLELAKAYREACCQTLQRAIDAAKKAGVAATGTHLSDVPVADSIVEAAGPGDLVIMNTHSR